MARLSRILESIATKAGRAVSSCSITRIDFELEARAEAEPNAVSARQSRTPGLALPRSQRLRAGPRGANQPAQILRDPQFPPPTGSSYLAASQNVEEIRPVLGGANLGKLGVAVPYQPGGIGAAHHTVSPEPKTLPSVAS